MMTYYQEQKLKSCIDKCDQNARTLNSLSRAVRQMQEEVRRQQATNRNLIDKLNYSFRMIDKLKDEIKDLRKKTGIDIAMPNSQELESFLMED